MFKPFFDKVLLKPNTTKDESSSGIVLSATKQETSVDATVIAVGDGHLLNNGEIRPLMVKEGDIVIVSEKGECERITIEDVEYLIMSEQHILGIKE